MLHEEAGSNEKRFQGDMKRDCDKEGKLHPKRRIRDPVTRKKRGMNFEDFVRCVFPVESLGNGTCHSPEAQTATGNR